MTLTSLKASSPGDWQLCSDCRRPRHEVEFTVGDLKPSSDLGRRAHSAMTAVKLKQLSDPGVRW
jgi:hypothetical protein